MKMKPSLLLTLVYACLALSPTQAHTRWPRADDPTAKEDPNNPGQRLKGKLEYYYDATTKTIDFGDGGLTVKWTGYLGFFNGSDEPSRTQVWLVGEIKKATAADLAKGIKLLKIGAQNRNDTIWIRVLYDNSGKLEPDLSPDIRYSQFVRDASGAITGRSGWMPAENTESKDASGKPKPEFSKVPEWCDQGFFVIKPAGKFENFGGIDMRDFQYLFKPKKSNFVLQAFFFDHRPDDPGSKEVEDGGTPPGDPSDLT